MNADVTQMNAEWQSMNRLSGAVIGAAQTVSNRLGCGFLLNFGRSRLEVARIVWQF